MTSRWYYQTMGEEIGPISPSQLREAAELGVIQSDTLIRKGDEGSWVFAERVTGLLHKANNHPSGPTDDLGF